MNQVNRNVASLIFDPANRLILVGLATLVLTILGAFTYIYVSNSEVEPKGNATVNSPAVKVGPSAVATGQESEEYLKSVREFNDTVLAEKRKENPSAHPLPINDGISENSCKANHDAWTNCLRVSGTLEEDECATTDTQCMIDNGYIQEGECAPSDMVCRKLLGLNDGGFCDPANYTCIAKRAKKAGCQVSDTACLRREGIISSEACAPGDEQCQGDRFSFCSVDDLGCIEDRARKAGCELSDSQCLRENGIIADTACGPEDFECKSDPEFSFCSPYDLACIVKKARKAGCEIDDTHCLRAAGIISSVACSPADTSCTGPKHGFCPESDLQCISKAAEKAGCHIADTNCLRSKGIIAETACAPADSKCHSSKVKCDPNDKQCLDEASKRTGCSPTDSECLISAGVLDAGVCLPGDPNCGSQSGRKTLCASGDTNCIAREASVAGCSLSDSGCLRENSIIGSTDCAPADSNCSAILASEQGGLRGGSSRDNKYLRAAEGRGNQSRAESNNLQDEEYMSQLLDLVANKIPSRKSSEVGFTNKNVSFEKEQNDSVANASAVTSATNKQTEVEEELQVLAKAADVLYGVNNIALSTDYEGPVSISIVNPGVLHNTTALGSMVQVRDKTRLELNRLVLTSGETININAIALDLNTTHAAVASSVDHHYLYRFGWWGLGTALSAVGKATALGAKETIIVPDGGVAESNELDSSGEAKVALGELGEDLGDAMKANMERPITVNVDVGEQVGIFFLDTVYKKADQ